jgi:hypothetical protein
MDMQITFSKVDEYLSESNIMFEAIIIGGAALNIMGVITRDTVDVDCLDPKVSEANVT